MIAPSIVAAFGIYQLGTERYNTQLILLVAAGVTVGQVAVLGSGTYIQAAAVALVVIGMVWTLFLPRVRWWHLASYSGLLVGAQVLWDSGDSAAVIIGGATGSVAAFIGASFIANHLQRSVQAGERRYHDLFDRSPIALWEEDFSQVRNALEELGEAGVDDLEAYLHERPGELNRLVGLIDVLDVNEAAVELVGVSSREELTGRLPEPQEETARESYVQQLLAVWERREELEYEFVGETRTGRTRDMTIRWSVKSHGATDYSHVIVAMSDISRRKQTERALKDSRDRFERLATNAADAITRLRLHPEPRWEYVSPAIEPMIGYTPEDFYADGYIMRRITHPADKARLAEFMDHPERWEEALTVRAISKSGKEVWAEMRMTPIYDGDGQLAYIETVSRDITERKEYETRLEELIRSKDEFVASVSHELRTPLTAVVGLAQELRDSQDSFSPAERSELIDMIAGQATEVADIVNDLLVAARADIGMVSIQPEAIDLAEEVCSVLPALPEEDQSRIDAVCHPTHCIADPTRVRQIIRNLLTNAFRYGGSHIELETAENDGLAILEVRDDGEGIIPEDVDRIFDPYQRAHPKTSQPASVGLGLTVSRQLARLMGGDVTYRKRDGLSVFVLSLPLAEQHPETEATEAQLSPTI
ncbi:MAG: ATP-binding protein [Acidimicrobiia bacterium]